MCAALKRPVSRTDERSSHYKALSYEMPSKFLKSIFHVLDPSRFFRSFISAVLFGDVFFCISNSEMNYSRPSLMPILGTFAQTQLDRGSTTGNLCILPSNLILERMFCFCGEALCRYPCAWRGESSEWVDTVPWHRAH